MDFLSLQKILKMSWDQTALPGVFDENIVGVDLSCSNSPKGPVWFTTLSMYGSLTEKTLPIPCSPSGIPPPK